MIFGAAYYPEHRQKEYWEYDLTKMEEAHINALRIGEFAWKVFEPNDGVYDFTWLDEFIEKAAKHNIKILLCPPLRTVPAWLVEKDNTILIENEQEVKLEYGSRYTFCINHPYLIEKGMTLAEEMSKRYGDNKNIIGWHLDNEYGDEHDCHCPICKEKWQNWLKEKYKDICLLNEEWGNVFWGLEFDDFYQIPTPKVTHALYNPALLQNWRNFRSECTIEIVKRHADTLRKYVKDHPITTNNQPLWNYRTDYYKLAEHLDVCGTNYYPPYGKNCRDIAFGLASVRSYKQKNFYIYELRNNAHMTPGRNENMPKPGEVERLTMHAFANGADGTYYFRWRSCPFGTEQNHGTIVSYNGEPTRIYSECKSTGEKLKRISSLLEGSIIKSEVGILYDYPTRWMEENNSGWMQARDFYINQIKKIYSAVRKIGVNCDAVGRDIDFKQYKVLIVPMISAFSDELADKFYEFVLNGGTLIWHPLSGHKNEDAKFYNGRLHPKMQQLFSVNVIDYGTADEDEQIEFIWNEEKYITGLFYDMAKTECNEKKGQYINTWFEGTPFMVVNQLGDGNTYYLTSFPEEKFYYDFLKDIFQKNEIQPILPKTIPNSLEITERLKGKEKFIFVLNCSNEKQEFEIDKEITDIWNQEKLETGKIFIKPNGVRILHRINRQ